MPPRPIASLTISFGLVSVPVNLYSATEASSSLRFHLLTKDGSRVRQQYVSERSGQVVARDRLVNGYEFEKDRYVLFDPGELKALEDAESTSIEIVAFIPFDAVDPLYYEKAYLLAPDERGAKPYRLLHDAMRQAGRSALAKWTWKARQHVVQLRPADGGLVLQQLFFANEVRKPGELEIEPASVSAAELKLALELVEQYAQPSYDPGAFADEEKARVREAIERKIAGEQIVAAGHEPGAPAGAQIIDLMQALRASLGPRRAGRPTQMPAKAPAPTNAQRRRAAARQSGARAAPSPATAPTPAPRAAARQRSAAAPSANAGRPEAAAAAGAGRGARSRTR